MDLMRKEKSTIRVQIFHRFRYLHLVDTLGYFWPILFTPGVRFASEFRPSSDASVCAEVFLKVPSVNTGPPISNGLSLQYPSTQQAEPAQLDLNMPPALVPDLVEGNHDVNPVGHHER